MRQEFFTASRGDGAQLEGKKIRVSTQRTLEGALIGTGFPYRMPAAHVDDYLAMLKAVMNTAAGVRRPGAASLDLAYVAAGRIDGFWEFGLAPWDTAAGTLLIQEAGGRVGTPTGAEYALGPNIVAGNPKVYQALLEAIGPLTPAALAGLSASPARDLRVRAPAVPQGMRSSPVENCSLGVFAAGKRSRLCL